MNKIILILVLITVPFNFILLEGIGNVYLSTVMLMLVFVLLFFKTKGSVVLKPNAFLALITLLYVLFTTYLNVFFNTLPDFKAQTVGSVIYIQNFLAFIIFYYLINNKSYAFFLKMFIAIALVSCLRVIIEEYDKIFLFSTRWGERIRVNFIGAMNNFALICGLAFFIVFFYVRKKSIKIILCLFLFFMISVSMSRGAFLGVIVTLFIVAIYDTNKKTLKLLLKTLSFSTVIAVIGVFCMGKSNDLIEKIQSRFLSVFSGEKDVETFSSGRFLVWEDILTRFFESNIYEILFGLGTGSIDFKVWVVHYHSSHNIFIDFLYKNGLFFLLFYVLVLFGILNIFFKNRNREKIPIFSFFIFLQFEIMFNPFPFAAQTGWLYFVFLVLFIKQNELIVNKN